MTLTSGAPAAAVVQSIDLLKVMPSSVNGISFRGWFLAPNTRTVPPEPNPKEFVASFGKSPADFVRADIPGGVTPAVGSLQAFQLRGIAASTWAPVFFGSIMDSEVVISGKRASTDGNQIVLYPVGDAVFWITGTPTFISKAMSVLP